MSSSEGDDRLCKKKEMVFNWLAEQFVLGNPLYKPSFKASTVRAQFASTSSTLIDDVITALVVGGQAHVESEGRVVIYRVDEANANLVARIPVPETAESTAGAKRAGQENAGKKEPKKSEKVIGDGQIKQKVKVVKALKTRDPNVSNEQNNVGVAAYEEELEEESDCGLSVVSDSPIFKFAPRSQSSISGDLYVGMTACLYKAFEHADQEGKSSIDVLRNIVTKQVGVVCDDDFREFLDLMQKENKMMITGDYITEV